ncbi:MAG: hypothetical protein SHS37scaffold145_14 [Phage 71_18]|nr:MAG: hypothetical protein SHS37scaffold145_14 [Phage 71_18]
MTAMVELGTQASLARAMTMTRHRARFTWRVRAFLGSMVAAYLFIAVVLLVGAGQWVRSPSYAMVMRVAPFRTWGVGALGIVVLAAFALIRDDNDACRLAFVATAGWWATWCAAFVAAWISGEALSPLGVPVSAMLTLWALILSGVPFTDPVREAAYGVVRASMSPDDPSAP